MMKMEKYCNLHRGTREGIISWDQTAAASG